MSFVSRGMDQGHAGSLNRGHNNMRVGCFTFRPRSWGCQANDSSSKNKATCTPRHSQQSDDESENSQSDNVAENQAQLPENDGQYSSLMATCDECNKPKTAAGFANYRRSSSPSRTPLESIPSYRPSSLSNDTWSTSMKCDKPPRRPLQKVSDLFLSHRRQRVSISVGAHQPPSAGRQQEYNDAGSVSTTTHDEHRERCRCQETDLLEAMKKVSLELASPTPRSGHPSSLLQRRASSPDEALRGVWSGCKSPRSLSDAGTDSGNPVLHTALRRSNGSMLLGDLERRKSGTYARRAELNARSTMRASLS